MPKGTTNFPNEKLELLCQTGPTWRRILDFLLLNTLGKPANWNGSPKKRKKETEPFSAAFIAKAIGKSPRSVEMWLPILVKAEIIRCVKRGSRHSLGSTWAVNLEGEWKLEEVRTPPVKPQEVAVTETAPYPQEVAVLAPQEVAVPVPQEVAENLLSPDSVKYSVEEGGSKIEKNTSRAGPKKAPPLYQNFQSIFLKEIGTNLSINGTTQEAIKKKLRGLKESEETFLGGWGWFLQKRYRTKDYYQDKPLMKYLDQAESCVQQYKERHTRFDNVVNL
jgi:hypothetical protein